jgi:hypothetical protein
VPWLSLRLGCGLDVVVEEVRAADVTHRDIRCCQDIKLDEFACLQLYIDKYFNSL